MSWKFLTVIFAFCAATGRGSYLPSTARIFTVAFPGAISTSGSPADKFTGALPAGVSRYVVQSVTVTATSASGTLALSTIDLRTATGGGGSSILAAPTALTALTAANLAQSISPAAIGSTFTAGSITLRQTVDSANAGTVLVIVAFIDLSP
jgi:hypothetical protein